MVSVLFLAAAVSPLAGQDLDRAIALHEAGKLREALQIYREVAAAAEPDAAAAALNNACVLQQDLGDFRAALPDCEQALRLRRAGGDAVSIAETLNNLGLALEALGRTEDAARQYSEALALNRKMGEAEAQAINLGNLAALALQKGRYSAAMRLFTDAGDLAARHRDQPWAATQREIARINQGVVLEKVGAYRQALDLYKGLLAGTAESLDARRRAALLVNAGVLYRNLGDPVSAVETFREAVASYRSLGDTAGLSNALLNLGIALHLNLERPKEAEEDFREALRLAEESGDRREEVQDLFYLGRLLLAQSRLAEAEAIFRRCLAGAIESGSAEGRWSAREGLGRIAAAGGDLPGALAHLSRALDEIEQVRAGIEQTGWRAGYFGDKRSAYAATVDVLWRLEILRPGKGFAGRALEVSQRAKARDLLDALGESPASPSTAAGSMARAGDDTLLEYFLGEDRLYRWTIRRSSLRMAELGLKRPILEAAAQIHRALARGKEPSPAAVARLSRTLLDGAISIEDERLRIAPDGLLHYLPFEILDHPAVRGRPLVERVAVSYLPSTSARMAAKDRRPAPLRLAGFGAPSSSTAPLALRRFEPLPLPAARRELDRIEDLLGGESVTYIGAQATEQAFRETFARGVHVVHFATHTAVDERPGGGAAILLSPAGEDDGLLYPREIAGLDGRADLAVLAACRTALAPDDASGDSGALVSLTGSFLAAGSAAVLATLWDVGDAATAAFMEQLYAQLGRGLAPEEALRQAKLRLHADPRWNRPSLWAGYVLVGEAPPVVPRSSRQTLRWVGAAVLALLGFAGLAASSRRLTRRRGSRIRASA